MYMHIQGDNGNEDDAVAADDGDDGGDDDDDDDDDEHDIGQSYWPQPFLPEYVARP